jgi:hypothetical protein
MAADSSLITIGGNFTGSGRTLTGANPTISAGGYIGTLASPIGISISGTLTIHAGGMNDYTSIALSGAGTCSWQETMPGFVFLNGNLQPAIGQGQIRSLLALSEKDLSGAPRTLPNQFHLVGGIGAIGMAGVPVIAPAPAIIPAPVIAPMPVSAVLITPSLPAPAAIPTVPAKPLPEIPLKPSFKGVIIQSMLPSERIKIEPPFSGARAVFILPRPAAIRESFKGVSSIVTLPKPVTMESFKFIIPQVLLPQKKIKPSFTGAGFAVFLPLAETKPDFSQASSAAQLPQAVLPQKQLKPSFTGASLEVLLLSPELKPSFSEATSAAQLPQAQLKPSFENMQAGLILPQRITAKDFYAIAGRVHLPQGLEPAFKAVTAAAILPRRLSAEDFIGASAAVQLPQVYKPSFEGIKAVPSMPQPVNPLTFKQVNGEVKIMFPSGFKVVPTFGVGVPLGAEKPPKEPQIKKEEKPRQRDNR